jgi:hypothetical protein
MMSGKKTTLSIVFSVVMAVIILSVGLAPAASRAASHREAPLISNDPTADITDFFMFRSYEEGHDKNVVLIMDVIPGEEPSAGPNYYNFDPNVLYAFNIDNNMDGRASDIRFEFQIKTEIRGVINDLDLFLGYIGGIPDVIDGINSLDHPGIGLRQTYTVTMVKGEKRTVLAKDLVAVPSNVGPRTMPDYESLAQQGIYDLKDGARVFAGQRDDPFYIDLGAIFDTLNVRSPGTDMLSGFNVHTIALEVPIKWLTMDGKNDDNDGGRTRQPVIGAYASTSRQKTTVLRGPDGMKASGEWVQVQRLANPLVNEVIIPTELKDRWNALSPAQESQFQVYYDQPRLALALQLVFGVDAATGGLDGADGPRSDLGAPFDLVSLLLKYASGAGDQRLSELLRLDVSVAPTPLDQQQNLTALAGDPAGWPNGRRPIDDVTDVATKVVGGPNYVGLPTVDGVDANDKDLPGAFPFISTPWDGRNRVHQNP